MEFVRESSQVKPAFLGAIGGAAAIVLVGFNFGGWVTTSTANELARQRADKEVVAALAPICVEKFREAPNATENLIRLKNERYNWDKRAYVIKGGWATLPGNDRPYLGVADACAEILAKL